MGFQCRIPALPRKYCAGLSEENVCSFVNTKGDRSAGLSTKQRACM